MIVLALKLDVSDGAVAKNVATDAYIRLVPGEDAG